MLTRRFFLQQSTAALTAIYTRALPATDDTLTVATPLGSVRGESKFDVNIFHGVPFAQPPVGPLRFLAPQPLKPWTGTRDALHFAAAASQPGEPTVAKSEDCLYLNLWAPKSPGPHPVFVWVHGGGFTGGRSFDPVSDGAGFAQSGVLVVTVAYRLGVFGFLDVEPMLGAAYAGSANNGLRDVAAALSWVKQNISAFGGDPNRVTVGGESAGAKLTDLLMAAPSAAPLFQQMISESGGAERTWPKDRAAEVGQGFQAVYTQSTSKPSASILEAPAEQLIALQEDFIRTWPAHFPLRPVSDGVFLPASPLASIRSGSARGKRLLLGTNLDESALFIGPHPAHDASARDLGNLTPDQFHLIDEAYKKLYPDLSPERRRIRSLTAEEYLIPSLRVADAHLDGGGQAFVYRLDFPGDGRFAGLAFHSYDLRFVWDRVGQADPASARSLAAAMHQAWTTFLKGDRPQGPDLPQWPAYTRTTRSTMILDAACHVAENPDKAELPLWEGMLTK